MRVAQDHHCRISNENQFQFLQEGARIQAQLTLSLTSLAKTKEKYEKAFGASEKALEAYNKADADLNLSRWKGNIISF